MRTDFRVDVHQIDAATKKVEHMFGRLGVAAAHVDRRLTGMFRALATPFGAFLGVAGASYAVKGLAGIGEQAESSELQITSLLLSAQKASGILVGGFDDAHAAAKALRMEFKQLAIESPVGFADIQEAFGLMATPLSRAGMTLGEQARFSRDVATRGQLEGRGSEIVARDVSQILNGLGGQAQINTIALKSISAQAAKLAKSGDMKAAAALIREALTMTPEELRAFEASYAGMFSTLTDKFRNLAEVGAKPLMTFLLRKMKEWSDWLDKNQDKAAKIAETIGRGVAGALDKVVRLAEFLGRHFDAIATTLQLMASGWIGARFIGFMSRAIEMASIFREFMVAGAVAGSVGNAASSEVKAIKGLWRAGPWGKVAAGAMTIGVAAASLFAMKGLFSSDEEQTDPLEAIKAALDKDLDAIGGGTAGKSVGGGGGGTQKVKKLVVERAVFRERDFSRLSAPQVMGTSARSTAGRPIAGLGLGLVTIGVR
ncbi:MAG: hypothetical protein AB7H92_16160 [Microbacteriaceae bacterium]